MSYFRGIYCLLREGSGDSDGGEIRIMNRFDEKQNKRERSPSMEVEEHGRSEKRKNTKKKICRKNMEVILGRLAKVESELECSQSEMRHLALVNEDMMMDIVGLKKEFEIKKQDKKDPTKTSHYQKKEEDEFQVSSNRDIKICDIKILQFKIEIEQLKFKLEAKDKELISFKKTSDREAMLQKERIDELTVLLQKVQTENEKMLKEVTENKNVCKLETDQARQEMETKDMKMRDFEKAFDTMSKDKQKEIVRLESEVEEFQEACEMEASVFKKVIMEKDTNILEHKKISEEASTSHQNEVSKLKSLVHEHRQKFEEKSKEYFDQLDNFVKEKANLELKVDNLELIESFIRTKFENYKEEVRKNTKDIEQQHEKEILILQKEIDSFQNFQRSRNKFGVEAIIKVTENNVEDIFDDFDDENSVPTSCMPTKGRLHGTPTGSAKKKTASLTSVLSNLKRHSQEK